MLVGGGNVAGSGCEQGCGCLPGCRRVCGNRPCTDPSPPPPHQHHRPQVQQDVCTLNTIAQALRKKRFDGGALRLDNTRLTFSLDAAGLPVGFKPYTNLQANQLIEEFMLLANMQVGLAG